MPPLQKPYVPITKTVYTRYKNRTASLKKPNDPIEKPKGYTRKTGGPKWKMYGPIRLLAPRRIKASLANNRKKNSDLNPPIFIIF